MLRVLNRKKYLHVFNAMYIGIPYKVIILFHYI